MESGSSQPDDLRPAARAGGVIERHRGIALVLSLVALMGAAGWLTYYYWPDPDRSLPVFNWYTVDDGATWFQDDAERIPPFDHDGKPAMRLHLFTCDGGKTTFVGYLQKLPEETLKAYRDKGIDPAKVDDDDLAAESGWLVKVRGDEPWINSKSSPEAYQKLVSVRCPDGSMPEEVFPKNPKK